MVATPLNLHGIEKLSLISFDRQKLVAAICSNITCDSRRKWLQKALLLGSALSVTESLLSAWIL
jgi:hypothetical protein